MGNVGGKINGKLADAIARINWAARYKAALQQIFTNIVFIFLCLIATVLILFTNIFRSTSFRVPLVTRVKNTLHVSQIKINPNIKQTAKELFR